MSYLGLDIGTSGCKAVIFEKDGSCTASEYSGYSVHSPNPGWAELDSGEVLDKCFGVIRQAVRKSTGSPVKAMGISSQGEAFTPVGEKGKLLGNAMVSSDGRAGELSEQWSRRFGSKRLYNITGHTSSPMFTLFKLLWLKQNRRDVWKKSRGFYCFEDLMHMRLGIEPALGWPLAGRTMMFDINNHRWSSEILDAIDLDAGKLARPMPSGSVAGTIPKKVAASLGLGPDVKVVTGGHDQTIGALGAGVLNDGSAMFATGTVECICPVLSRKVLSTELFKNNLCCYDYSLPGKYTSVAYSLTGGNILQWFKNEFGQPEIAMALKKKTSPYDLLLKQMPDSPTDLLVLPYFTPSGTPYFDLNTRGAIIGLRMTTSRQEIMKALLEAVALEMKLNLDLMSRSGMKINRLIATGGGARNPKWVQLKADVMNKPIVKMDVEEAGCFGAAMLACAADTGIPVKKLLSSVYKDEKKVNPNPARAEQYQRKFEHYKQLYPSIKALSKTIYTS